MVYNECMKKIEYKTIKNEVLVEQEISKSKFLSFLSPIKDEDEAKAYLKLIKKSHPKATHHCSAFIVDEIERSNDDGEPSSSAGLPMLEVLRGNHLNRVIAVVVRYYGGTKLGVGGLIRAYGSSVTLAIDSAIIMVPVPVYIYDFKFPYAFTNDIEVYLSDLGEIVDRSYDALATYRVALLDENFKNDLNDLTKGQIEITKIDEKIDYREEKV